ncbi:protein phosphatase 1 regulatory subunit 35 isoform X2 [Echeneis naucrates]|uniref:protein phosphatase 1 regulatory subunit 35 isoform X2 n=1 Tax=Echeneis naucrates TaxID=173247 RepID=UPI0011143450|nr:protein phosphatase 1 regulatory subunit 35-like isoform X2 [Echeneis naucrates]
MSSTSTPSPPPSPHPVPLSFPSTSFMIGCPELDLSITLGSTPKTSNSQLKHHPRGQSQKKRDTQVCFEDPLVVKVTPECHITISNNAPSQQPHRGPRGSRGCHHPRQLVESPVAAVNSDMGCPERAELNTTLALRAELQSLQSTEFNVQRAIQKTLQKSERTKNLISSRATEVVNISRSRSLFNSLVSVDVQKDQLIGYVQQDMRPLVMRSHIFNIKAVEGPSLLHVIPSDLLRQKPFSPDEALVSQKSHLSQRLTRPTFDLYRRQSRWEATP